MELMDLKDEQKNPIFKVLHVKENQAEMLKVSPLIIRLAWFGYSYFLICQ